GGHRRPARRGLADPAWPGHRGRGSRLAKIRTTAVSAVSALSSALHAVIPNAAGDLLRGEKQIPRCARDDNVQQDDSFHQVTPTAMTASTGMTTPRPPGARR